MATHVILTVTQRDEDGKIALNTSIPNPLIILDLLTVVQKTMIAEALSKMEVKKESAIITGQSQKDLITV